MQQLNALGSFSKLIASYARACSILASLLCPLPLPGLVPGRRGLCWDRLPRAGAAVFYPQLRCLQLIGLLIFVPGMHHKKNLGKLMLPSGQQEGSWPNPSLGSRCRVFCSNFNDPPYKIFPSGFNCLRLPNAVVLMFSKVSRFYSSWKPKC